VTRALLVVGHPGHELRVYGWLRSVRPVVHVLTDGSGREGTSRLRSTTAVIEDAGAARGTIYGRMTDSGIYKAVLDGEHARFTALADELADAIVSDGIDTVAGDAVEGFNPSHDVCRYVVNAAVRLARARTGRDIACYAFPLEAAPDAPLSAGGALRLRLDEAVLSQKLSAAEAYEELRAEVRRALDRFGPEAFRTECLWPADVSDRYGWDAGRTPFYEMHGAQRVACGAYERVVTFREHVKPLADALWCHRAAV